MPAKATAPLLCSQPAIGPQPRSFGSRAAVSRAAGHRLRPAAAPRTTEGASTSGRGAAGRKAGGAGKGRRRKGGDAEDDEGVEEDVEIFNLETGWTVEELKEGLGKWNLCALDGGAEAEEDIDPSDASDSGSDNEATSWSTSNFVGGDDVEDDSHLWSAKAMVEGDDDWGADLEDDGETDVRCFSTPYV